MEPCHSNEWDMQLAVVFYALNTNAAYAHIGLKLESNIFHKVALSGRIEEP
jgi:hypothetical protein